MQIPIENVSLSQATAAERHLGDNGIDAAQSPRPPARQVIHGVEANVQPLGREVNGQDVDCLAPVRRLPASTAVGRIPLADCLDTANVWEAGYISLCLPPVLPHDAVLAVRAHQILERPAGVVVTRIVSDFR